LERKGRDLIIVLLAQGKTDQGFDSAFDLLGNLDPLFDRLPPPRNYRAES
jgi:hypothetical protein